MYRLTTYFFSHVIKIKWFQNIYIRHKNLSKFSQYIIRRERLSSAVVRMFLEIVADVPLARKIETIEDALGNDVYFLSLKNDRKRVDRDNELAKNECNALLLR